MTPSKIITDAYNALDGDTRQDLDRIDAIANAIGRVLGAAQAEPIEALMALEHMRANAQALFTHHHLNATMARAQAEASKPKLVVANEFGKTT